MVSITILFILTTTLLVDTIIAPILQIKELKYKQVITKGHTACKWWSRMNQF